MVRETESLEIKIKDQRTQDICTQTHTTKKDFQFRNKIGSKFKIKINL